MLISRIKTIVIVLLGVTMAIAIFQLKRITAIFERQKQEIVSLHYQLATTQTIKDSQSKQISQLVQERNELSMLLQARVEEQNSERERLSQNIAVLKKELSDNQSFNTPYPKSVLKRLRQSY
ncbi:hypothetical protein [Photobacterium damselae]|uniref:hypothetical protein n=1 Tax=Photobacterium damselae TaxID=38293 RepID=UPI001F30CB82|nr:hypothetical protein [Photobacterium damselae]UKA11722.1 hypothetical protein IHC91_18235 [Photobacterium damselae subsp. damselae]